MHYKALTVLFTLAGLITLSSCQPTRFVQEGQHLLVTNVIHLNENGEDVCHMSAEDLEAILKQKPNRKIAGILPFHISVWNYANRHDTEKKRWSYLRDEVGEAPVLFDQVLFERSRGQLEKYLQNSGYFQAKVTAYAFKSANEVEQHFYVFTGPAYTLRTMRYSFEDPVMNAVFNDTSLNEEIKYSLLTRGTIYSTETLAAERARLTRCLKELGFYSFERIHVNFDIDTNVAGDRYDVQVRIRKNYVPKEINGRDTLVGESHQRYRIHEIFINESYEPAMIGRIAYDTLRISDFTFLFSGKPVIKPTRIARNIYVKPGEYYSLSHTNYTYDRISALNNFKFIDISYELSETTTTSAEPELDMRVNLTKSAKHAMSVETVGTNRGGNLGVSASLNYKNRNLFRGAEAIDWKIYGGLEAQRTNSTIANETNEAIQYTPFNTFEYGTQISLTIPDLLFRSPRSRLQWLLEPKTSISLTLDRQSRPLYDRGLLNTTYLMSARLRPQDLLEFAPIYLSVIELDKDAAFEQQLINSGNSLLINSYNNHIVPAGRISYQYSSQDLGNPLKNYHIYKLNVESSGNILRALGAPLQLKQVGNSYLINNIAFAQYVKVDANYAWLQNLNFNKRMAYRVFGGAGVPLTNLNTLPFERAFFAGGSNGIRAWQARALGPGSLSDTVTYGIDQVGELHLEFNAEFRFDLFKQLKGAIFADVGNIWLLQYDPKRPGAEFSFDRFYREIAIAPGAGVRFDLSFFVIRADMGLQLKDPGLPQGERWAYFQPKTQTNQFINDANARNPDLQMPNWTAPKITLNLAIGYPFGL